MDQVDSQVATASVSSFNFHLHLMIETMASKEANKASLYFVYMLGAKLILQQRAFWLPIGREH